MKKIIVLLVSLFSIFSFAQTEELIQREANPMIQSLLIIQIMQSCGGNY